MAHGDRPRGGHHDRPGRDSQTQGACPRRRPERSTAMAHDVVVDVVGDVAVGRPGHYVIKTSPSRPSPKPPEGAGASDRDRAPGWKSSEASGCPSGSANEGSGAPAAAPSGCHLDAVVRNHGSRDPPVGYRAGPAPLRVPALRMGRARGSVEAGEAPSDPYGFTLWRPPFGPRPAPTDVDCRVHRDRRARRVQRGVYGPRREHGMESWSILRTPGACRSGVHRRGRLPSEGFHGPGEHLSDGYWEPARRFRAGMVPSIRMRAESAPWFGGHRPHRRTRMGIQKLPKTSNQGARSRSATTVFSGARRSRRCRRSSSPGIMIPGPEPLRTSGRAMLERCCCFGNAR